MGKCDAQQPLSLSGSEEQPHSALNARSCGITSAWSVRHLVSSTGQEGGTLVCTHCWAPRPAVRAENGGIVRVGSLWPSFAEALVLRCVQVEARADHGHGV